MKKMLPRCSRGLILLFFIGTLSLATQAFALPRIFVIMSYHPEYKWSQEVRSGIESRLKGKADLEFFYLDTKNRFDQGPRMAQEALKRFQMLQPQGVIAVDDNAQSMFVVPFLKNKVDIPVIFCGVNKAAETYGYPASNVTGILERFHIRESIDYAMLLVPEIEKVGYIARDNPTGKGTLDQIRREAKTYPARFVDFKLAATLPQALEQTRELRQKSDLLYIGSLEGIVDKEGVPMTDEVAIRAIAAEFNNPTFVDVGYRVQYGILCAVVQKGQEQGSLASDLMLRALSGTPFDQLPITQNRRGRRILNLTTMDRLGIRPKPEALIGATLIRTRKAGQP